MATHPLLPACAALALLAACGVGREAANAPAPGTATFAESCTRCHGSGNDPAPPRSARGETSTTALGVGAHQAHLKDGVLHRAFACSECHVVPTDTKHVDGVARVAFGATANAAGVTSTWDHASATCATYCHGATLPGGALTRPVWTAGSSQAACGTCHGAPPPAPHPQVPDCGLCHPGYGRDFVNPTLHVNRVVDVAGLACTSCHGDASRASNAAAPPVDTKGSSATTARGVGAHQAHLFSSLRSGAVACAECHVVPTSTAHANGTATVTFGPLARTGGAAATFDGAALTCAVYCHGATLNAGGTATAPVWTRVDGSQKTCTSCHGAPPPAPHPASTQCGSCHSGYGATSVNPATHLNGTVDVAGLSCTSCHGDASRASNAAAPPVDTKGNSATTAPGVGAHQSHLFSSLRSGAVACAECHVVPTSPTHSTGTVNVVFGQLSRTGGAAATFDGASLTCAVYCHGATLNAGGTATAPVWTRVDGSQKTCTSCHGAPPPAPHPANTQCGSCHSGYSSTSVNPATHLNGTIDVTGLSCTSCHGDAARASNAPAPPVDTKGNSATTAPGVGAHQSHLGSQLLASPVACTECHVVPTSTAHANGTVNVTFGPLARTGGAAATFDASALTCAVYCHGSTLNAGGAATAPVWTRVDGSQKSCTSCHGAPPPAPHPANSQCGSCHSGYSSTSVNAASHLNGVVDVTGLSCTSCHGDAARASNAPAPPVDTKGSSATTARGVGAHQAHLFSSLRSGAVACTECHVVPTSTTHANGTVNVTFGPLARTGGAAATFDGSALTCAVYCHGATLNAGGAATAPVWTRVDGSQKTCTSCHGAPPPAPHPASSQCGSCHSGYTSTSVNPATHLNGTLDVVALTCTSCHGDASRASNAPAPPVDTKGSSATTARGVGAHQAHLFSSLRSGAVACTDCHVVPTSTTHANGTVNVTFGGAATMTGQSPAWNTSTLSCSATACHDSSLTTGGSARQPVWTRVDGTQKTCASCHGAPPSSGQHQRSEHVSRSCSDCHGSGYSASSGAVNPALHINGVKNVGGAGSRINSWNPSTRSCAPACHGTETW